MRLALRAYVLAGIPVILPVVHSRLGQRFGAGARTTDSSTSSPDHVLLVVGCGRPDDSDEFLVNDPASLPFLRASASELYRAAAFSKSHGMSRVGTDACTYLPVSCAPIRMPVDSWIDENDAPRPGLWDLMEGLGTAVTRSRVPWKVTLPDSAISDSYRLWLVRLDELVSSKTSADGTGTATRAVKEINSVLPRAGKIALQDIVVQIFPYKSDLKGQWCWVVFSESDCESDSATLWVWDAMRAPAKEICMERLANGTVEFAEIADLLLACSMKGRVGWESVFIAPPRQRQRRDSRWIEFAADVHAKVMPERRLADIELQPALVSSFTTFEFERAFEVWPDGLPCDFWVPMLGGALSGSPQYWTLSDARTLLARFAQDRARLQQLALRVSAAAKRAGSEIISLATFFPELFSRDRRLRDESARALQAVIRIAQHLREIGHRTSTITLVGCNRISDFQTNESPSNGRPRHLARLMSDEDAVIRLFEGLRPAVEEIDGESLTLALEVEPGPLYFLNGLQTMIKVAARLDSDPVLRHRVGFNLDIAHFRLCGIDPTCLMTSDAMPVRQRIVHCHISDQGCGHFGDCAPGDIALGMDATDVEQHSVKERMRPLKEWMRVLREIAARGSVTTERGPSFSGYVALQLEACKNLSLLRLAIERMRVIARPGRGNPPP